MKNVSFHELVELHAALSVAVLGLFILDQVNILEFIQIGSLLISWQFTSTCLQQKSALCFYWSPTRRGIDQSQRKKAIKL